MTFLALPVVIALGFTGDPILGIGYMNIALADWLIVGVIDVSLMMDNWPKGYSQGMNFLVRLVLIVLLAIAYFWGYYIISPLLFLSTNPLINSPTAFIIVMLWLQLIFAYLWRRWPIFQEMK